MKKNSKKTRPIRIIIFFAILLVSLNAYSFQTCFLPDTLHVNKTGNFNIDLNVEQNSDGFRGFKVYLKYNPELCQFISAEKGALVSGFSSYWWRVVQESADVIRVECIVLGAGLSIDDSGAILDLTFRNVRDGVENLTVVDQEFYYAVDGEIIPDVATQPGTVIVNCAALPVITDPTVQNITAYSAYLGGTVVDDGGSAIIERGVVWSQTGIPTVSSYTGKKIVVGNTGDFTVNATGLQPGATYFFRAYASSYRGTKYTETRSFETSTITLPVELSGFWVDLRQDHIALSWETQSESNNYGFEIERLAGADGQQDWARIGFVAGHGNSSATLTYSFTDRNAPTGQVQYRLRQIDTDGAFSYSAAVEVTVTAGTFQLLQNYPNPFNASTIIPYHLPAAGFVRLSLFNLCGQLVATIFAGEQSAGQHQCTLMADQLPSGVYFYKIEAGEFSEIRTLTLLK
ncbi:MAG: T9SS type A sorting domain-containing protein [Candidatus Zhuqueibacterota bacterium]